MANELLLQLLAERLEPDPYQNREFIADTVGDPPNSFGGGELGSYWNSHLSMYGKSIWRYSRMALNFWTPEPVEHEAYRRATDQPSVSKISQEVARFQVIYEKWLELAWDFQRAATMSLPLPLDRQVQFIRESINETLLALERRAQAAEQRSTDLRLRYEFDRLRAVVTGEAMAVGIVQLVQAAIASPGTESAVYERFAPMLARLEKDMRDTRNDVVFVADLAGEEFMARQLPGKKVAAAAGALTGLVPGVAGKVLGFLVKLFDSK